MTNAKSANMREIKLNPGDSAIVAQYIGPRLPEGATTLPEGAKLKFYLVKMISYADAQLRLAEEKEHSIPQA